MGYMNEDTLISRNQFVVIPGWVGDRLGAEDGAFVGVFEGV